MHGEVGRRRCVWIAGHVVLLLGMRRRWRRRRLLLLNGRRFVVENGEDVHAPWLIGRLRSGRLLLMLLDGRVPLILYISLDTYAISLLWRRRLMAWAREVDGVTLILTCRHGQRVSRVQHRPGAECVVGREIGRAHV